MLRKFVLEFPRVCLASRSVGSTFASEILGMTSAAVRTAAPAALAIGLILVGAGDVVRSAEPAKPAGATVIVAKATKACFSASVQVTGFLVARREALVTLDIDGYRVTEIQAKEGDTVTAGQLLVRLTRQEGAAPPGAPPGAAPPGAPPGAAAQAPPATMFLRAPAAGTVTRAAATIGATANPRADPLFRIAIDGEIELEAEVPSIHIPKLATGQTSRVEIEDRRELTGFVRLVPAEINPMSQLGKVRIGLERDASLRLGSFGRATIDASRSCGISVPKAAVLYRTEGTSVQVVRDRVVETRRVRVGFHSDLNVEIREGIREGDVVVANAGTSLRDGDQVQPKFADEFGQVGER
jgi:multidrug efflux pump subunit AcrA (membrane-fusion protein)